MRRVLRLFDPLIANDENPNNKILTLFFGIPKGTFYKKSPLAGYGAKAPYMGLTALSEPPMVILRVLPPKSLKGGRQKPVTSERGIAAF